MGWFSFIIIMCYSSYPGKGDVSFRRGKIDANTDFKSEVISN